MQIHESIWTTITHLPVYSDVYMIKEMGLSDWCSSEYKETLTCSVIFVQSAMEHTKWSRWKVRIIFKLFKDSWESVMQRIKSSAWDGSISAIQWPLPCRGHCDCGIYMFAYVQYILPMNCMNACLHHELQEQPCTLLYFPHIESLNPCVGGYVEWT